MSCLISLSGGCDFVLGRDILVVTPDLWFQVDELKKREEQLSRSKQQLQQQVQQLTEREAELYKQLHLTKDTVAQLEGELLAHKRMIDTTKETVLLKVRRGGGKGRDGEGRK
jgi:FtsZ-binding cell division protein ZapB